MASNLTVWIQHFKRKLNFHLDPDRCLLAERDLVRSPAHFILRSCMLEDFSLSDKSELFPLNPVSGSSTFSSSTSCNEEMWKSWSRSFSKFFSSPSSTDYEVTWEVQGHFSTGDHLNTFQFIAKSIVWQFWVIPFHHYSHLHLNFHEGDGLCPEPPPPVLLFLHRPLVHVGAVLKMVHLFKYENSLLKNFLKQIEIWEYKKEILWE